MRTALGNRPSRGRVPILLTVLALAWPWLLSSARPSYAEPAQSAFSYDGYAAALKACVNDQGLVKYADLKAHRDGLDAFVASLNGLDSAAYEAWDRNAKIAFWCNAYNAITLKYIIDHYPIQKGSWLSALRFPANSIRQIDGVWDTLTAPVMGKPLTLEGIENDILRGQFKEPRIHMAIVCASIGCPYLRAEPYAGDRLDQQLDDQARRFLGNRNKFRLDKTENAVYLSPIFDWFGKDFVDAYTPDSGFEGNSAVQRAVLNFISRYVAAADAQCLSTGKYAVHYLDYDWTLNEQK